MISAILLHGGLPSARRPLFLCFFRSHSCWYFRESTGIAVPRALSIFNKIRRVDRAVLLCRWYLLPCDLLYYRRTSLFSTVCRCLLCFFLALIIVTALARHTPLVQPCCWCHANIEVAIRFFVVVIVTGWTTTVAQS